MFIKLTTYESQHMTAGDRIAAGLPAVAMLPSINHVFIAPTAIACLKALTSYTEVTFTSGATEYVTETPEQIWNLCAECFARQKEFGLGR